MKANEAPERVYINPLNLLAYNGYYAFTTKNDDNSVEYTRTDAFIEKALRWMTSQGGVNDVLSREMIEDFKTYMKGE